MRRSFAVEADHSASGGGSGFTRIVSKRLRTTFPEVPPGDLQFTIHAQDFAPAALRVVEENRVAVVVLLKRAF